MTRALLGLILLALCWNAAALASDDGSWRFFWGDERTFIGSKSDDPATAIDEQHSLAIHAGDDLNVWAEHIRFGSQDGNYEFESSGDFTYIQAYRVGTPRLIPLIVRSQRMTVNVRQRIEFVVGGKTVAVIDKRGLRNLVHP